jgi:uncharacterized protein (TIGR01319 family)
MAVQGLIPMLLIDFGSTYTKVLAIDSVGRFIAKAKAPTTIHTDINEGLNNAIAGLKKQYHINKADLKERYASSSAAGGLKLVAIGLVPSLTLEAAKQAALGAGAKMIGNYSYQLYDSRIREIESLAPEVILLTGGTNGGDRDTIINNARMLSESAVRSIIIVAGNEVVSNEVTDILKKGGKRSYIAENVLPELDKLNVEPTRTIIRDVFIKHIVEAKGLDKVEKNIDAVLMPTPYAVLKGTRFIEESHMLQGDGLMTIDVGGATTDVHSIYKNNIDESVVYKGLPNEVEKRTVEGDLGLRHNIDSIYQISRDLIFNIVKKEGFTGSESSLVDYIDRCKLSTAHMPESNDEILLEKWLTVFATKISIERHVGTLKRVRTPSGEVSFQDGKDFRHLNNLIVTGGPLLHQNVNALINAVWGQMNDPFILKPLKPKIYLDQLYAMFAIGLLSEIGKEQAYRLGEESITLRGEI